MRSSSRRTSSGCRSSTSASRYSATVRSVPENSAANRAGSGCPASDSAASRSPAAQPSVRSCSSRQRRVGQLHPGGRQQLPGLGQGELQVTGADLGQLALQPQPVQAQPHVMPGRQHEPQLRRGPHDQQLQLPQRLRVQLVHVIDHQPQPLVQRRQVAQQPLRQRPPVQVRRRRHRPHRPRPGRSGAARRTPTARTVAGHAPRAPPPPTPPAPPARPRRSTTAAKPSSRCPPAPTPPSPAPAPEPPQQHRTRHHRSRYGVSLAPSIRTLPTRRISGHRTHMLAATLPRA